MKNLLVNLLFTFSIVFCCATARAQDDSFAIKVVLLSTEASAKTLVSSLQKTNGPAPKAEATLQQPRVEVTLRGQVTDEAGDVVVGATVTLVASNNREKVTATSVEGRYVFSALAPGRYIIRVSAAGFANYEKTTVEVSPGLREPLNVRLSVVLKDEVTVGSEPLLSTDPDSNASALVLRGNNLNTLPDNPESLAAFLSALTGTSVGLGGSQMLVDGFTGGRIPPKEAIREVRINQNPFSAEFDRPGSGRIEVTTKLGTNKFQGGLYFSFNDESLNSRNPFVPARAPFQSRFYSGNAGGSLAGKRASYFVNLWRQETDNNAIVNAVVLDPTLNVTRFSQVVLVPQRSTFFSPRFDYQPNKNLTLVGRYTYASSRSENMGVGEFSLPSRAYNTSNVDHTLQLTETTVLSKELINETRFQYSRERRRQVGDNSVAALKVLEAFTGGGSQVGSSFANEDRFALYNYTTWALRRQTMKFGGRLRGVYLEDASPANFGGTYTFAGGLAPQLGANNEVVRDVNGQPALVPITSLERYRRTLLFQSQGLAAAELRAQGGGAIQFSIAGGKPEASVGQIDLDAFLQTEWRVRNNLGLSVGVRYERQTNINSNLNLAPRVSLAWSPGTGKARPLNLVIRGGLGIFYDRFGEGLTLQANRFNGITQQQFVVTDPSILDLYPSAPSVTSLTAFAIPQTIRRVSDNLRSPYTIQSTISGEKQLPYNLTLSIALTNTRTLHALRSRNINAPLPGTFIFGAHNSGARPYGNLGNIIEFESSGVFDQRQLAVNVSNRLSNNLTLFAAYILNKATSDTDGAGSFPADTYNLSAEYGRYGLDIRHQFYFGSSIGLPHGIYLSSLVIVHSDIPFNITTGRDTNNDSIFSERPAFATDLSKPDVVVTRLGAFDANPTPAQEIIPRNYGLGPGFFIMNLHVSKTFKLSNPLSRKNSLATQQPEAITQRANGARSLERSYNITLSIQVQNLFNHTNFGVPIGNLSSPFFGQPLWTAGDSGFGDSNSAGNRRIEAQIRFTF